MVDICLLENRTPNHRRLRQRDALRSHTLSLLLILHTATVSFTLGEIHGQHDSEKSPSKTRKKCDIADFEPTDPMGTLEKGFPTLMCTSAGNFRIQRSQWTARSFRRTCSGRGRACKSAPGGVLLTPHAVLHQAKPRSSLHTYTENRQLSICNTINKAPLTVSRHYAVKPLIG